MKRCPVCQTENQDTSQFCKKCRAQLSDSTFQDKKEKVLGKKKIKSSWTPVFLTFIAMILVGMGYWLIKRDTVADPKISSQPKVSNKVNYSGQIIRMTDIQAKIENNKISIPVNIVKEKKIVYFQYEGNGRIVPLLSYLSPSGRVVTAVSLCEPCRSTRFHIDENKLICNACATEWTLEDLKGIQGGCLDYPPDIIPNRINGDQIQVDEKDVTQWRPRV